MVFFENDRRSRSEEDGFYERGRGMSILKLKPSCKDYLWGGHRLVEEYKKEYSGEVLAETWELSCHPAGPSYVDN